MVKITIKLILIILFSIALGAGIFSFVIAKKLYFPNITEVANNTGAGLHMTAYQYTPWIWNKEKITVLNIYDRKNDAPNTQYKLKGEIRNIRLIYSGEDYALIAYSSPDFSSMEIGYVVYRSPKSESDNTIKKIHIGGNIIAVAPDESGYFYISSGKIFKRSWDGDTIMSANLEMELEPILRTQLISIGNRLSYQPVLFFSNNTKMAFWGIPVGEPWFGGYLFIWDLENNEMEKISRQNFDNYDDLIIEDDKLYIEKINNSFSKKIVAE